MMNYADVLRHQFYYYCYYYYFYTTAVCATDSLAFVNSITILAPRRDVHMSMLVAVSTSESSLLSEIMSLCSGTVKKGLQFK